MKVLIVHSSNRVSNSLQYVFIKDQTDALLASGIDIDFFGIKGKGVIGYLSNYKKFIQKLKEFKPDLIHAHYGLSGAFAIIQGHIPVVITFHNGETLTRKGNLISSTAALFSSFNIYVARHIYELSYLKRKRKSIILPCGVDLDKITLIPKEQAQQIMNLPAGKKNILFGGPFDNLRKNVSLAREAIALMDRQDINLIELKNWSREQVYTLLCGCDLMLLTSKSEGSPQIVKEAMACNCPVVATDIADIRQLLENTDGCYITDFQPDDIAKKISLVLAAEKRANGRDRILELELDNKIIAGKLAEIYTGVINQTS